MEILNKAREEQGLPPLGKKESTDKIAEVTSESAGSNLIDEVITKNADSADKDSNNDQADNNDEADTGKKNNTQDPFSSHVIDIDINKETTY